MTLLLISLRKQRQSENKAHKFLPLHLLTYLNLCLYSTLSPMTMDKLPLFLRPSLPNTYLFTRSHTLAILSCLALWLCIYKFFPVYRFFLISFNYAIVGLTKKLKHILLSHLYLLTTHPISLFPFTVKFLTRVVYAQCLPTISRFVFF